MHGKNRHSQIDYVHVHMRYILSDCSAAAHIDSAELTDLPVHALLIHHGDDLCHHFGAGIVG